MAEVFSQGTRLGELLTDLGSDVLVLLRLKGSDRINGLFQYDIEALTTRPQIDFNQLVGTHASVVVDRDTHESGFDGVFDGIVSHIRWAGVGENGHRYDMTLRPWLWLAGKRRNQRIFHNLTAPDILSELFTSYAHLGQPAFEMRLTHNYPTLEYTVQYGESDMDFACRMMERFGISYHFVHDEGSHTMVLTDSVDSHDFIPGKERPYFGATLDKIISEEHFWEWYPERNLTTGAVRLTDYNFKTPTAVMEADRIGDAAYSQGQIECFDYPGDYPDQESGKRIASLRIAQERGGDIRHRATGNCVGLGAGKRMVLEGDSIPNATGQDFICLQADYLLQSQAYGSGAPQGNSRPFVGQYVMMPTLSPLAPPRRTPVPRIYGPQTAMVVGQGEIDCDDYGRILVRFHWDLEGAKSMRCRVSQLWAGPGWGGIAIPRIGMEVVVEFLEGDPDKPLVTGCVYNAKNMPPYGLPGGKSRMSLRSTTHEGGGFNELRLEDQAGSEEIFLHAQKDHNTVIGNNESHQIGVDRSKTVGNNQSETIGSNKTITVGVNHSETIGANMSQTVGANQSITVSADRDVSVGANETKTVSANQSETIGNKQTTSATDISTSASATQKHTAGNELKLKVGGSTITLTPDSIKLKHGGSTIVLDASGVKVDGPVIHLNKG